MEFGRLPGSQLNKIDFGLPKEPGYNKTILTGKKNRDAKVFMGCAKWGREEWVGKIYPKGTKEKDFLSLYVDCYNSIELNATSYKMPAAAQIKRWEANASGKDFLFCPKLTRYILPSADMDKEKQYIKQFLEAVDFFGENLGPLFLLLPESFSPAKKELLYDFLTLFPKTHQLFIEVRNTAWYSDATVFKELLNELSVQKTGFIITDTEGRRDMAHMHLTIPKAFVRFVGNSLHETDYERCDEWVKRIGYCCLLYTSPSPRDGLLSRMPSSA